jgi:hypothetical protein
LSLSSHNLQRQQEQQQQHRQQLVLWSLVQQSGS